MNDTAQGTLEDLERLRKKKRLAELRRLAGDSSPGASQSPPPSYGSARAVIDDGEDYDIDAIIEDAASQIPGGYQAWLNGWSPKTGADGRRVWAGVGKESDPATSNFYVKSEAETPVMSRKPPPPSPPKPKPPPPRQTTDWHFGDPALMSDEALAKRDNANGDAAGRILPSAANAMIGGVDFLSEPGRWADDAIGAVAPWWPSLVWDDQGFRLETAGSMSDEEKGYGGVGRIPMTEAKNDAERVADMVGEGIGFLGPGKVVNSAAQKTGQVASKLPGVSSVIAATTAKGSNAAARGARYGRRLLSTVPEAGAQAFVFGASTADRSIIDEDGSIDYVSGDENALQRGAAFATNPLSYVAPVALSGVYRAGVGIANSGRTVTPQAVRTQVAPHMLTNTDKALATLGDLPMPAGIQGKDADAALRILYRSLSEGGAPDDVLYAAVQKYNQMPGDRPPPAVFLRSELAPYAKSVSNLEDAIYEIGQKAPQVGQALREMRTTQGDRLRTGLQSSLGKGTRVKRDRALEKRLRKLGEEAYEPILAAGPVDQRAAANLRTLLNDTEFMKEIPADYRAQLSLGAIDNSPPPASTFPARPREAAGQPNAGPDMMGGNPLRGQIALQQRIAENPLEVAHKLYSSLNTRIRESRGAEVGRLKEIRKAIKKDLFAAGGPAYRDVNSKYYKASQARRALSSPDRLFAQSLKTHEIEKMKDLYKVMTAEEKKSFQTSLQGLLEDEFLRARTNNDFTNLGRMNREGTLKAIEEILDVRSSTKGSDIVRQIRNIVDEQDTIDAVDPSVKTNRGDRLASGREAYAGKVGALEHTGRYDLKAMGEDALMTMGANAIVPGFSGVLPIRAAYRGIQKALAHLSTPSRSGRESFARVVLERPNTPGNPRVDPAVLAARARRQQAARNMYRVNGRFGGRPEFLDPEAPGPGQSGGFDAEGFARSMSDEGPPKLPDDGGGGSAAAVIDENYQPPPRDAKSRDKPQPKQLPGAQRVITDQSTKVRDEEPRKPQTAAERYVEELRQRKRELEAKLDEEARQTEAARGDRRAAERAAADAERLRAQEESIRNQTKSEGLRAERERERQLAAEQRAERAARWAEESDAQGPPEVKDGPFQKFGRMEDRWRAPAGDPRSLRDAMNYLVGEGERAAVSNNLRRFGRDSTLEWYNAPEINRANDLLRAAQGQKEGVAPEALAIVSRLNKANREWLAQQLEEPQNFDLLEMMAQIDNLPAKGPKELEYGAAGPIVSTAAGLGAAALGGKALYDAREKRTPQQIEADRRRLYGEDTGDELFATPDDTEVRQIQAALNAMGYTDDSGNPLKVDGALEPPPSEDGKRSRSRTREAILKFATANGLQPHGLNPGGLSNAILEKIREYYQ